MEQGIEDDRIRDDDVFDTLTRRRELVYAAFRRATNTKITRNEMTHPPRIISRKRLIKASRGRTINTSYSCADSAYNYHRESLPFSSTLFFISFYLIPRIPLSSIVPAENPPRVPMICNFDNQSHERRLIFIITSVPPLYLAWESKLLPSLCCDRCNKMKLAA